VPGIVHPRREFVSIQLSIIYEELDCQDPYVFQCFQHLIRIIYRARLELSAQSGRRCECQPQDATS